jgi:hypothetical protein
MMSLLQGTEEMTRDVAVLVAMVDRDNTLRNAISHIYSSSINNSKAVLNKIVNNILNHETAVSADNIISILSKYDIEEIQLLLECTLELLDKDAVQIRYP